MSNIINAPSGANDDARPLALRADGMTLKIDVERLNSFSLKELIALAGFVGEVCAIFARNSNNAAFYQPSSDPEAVRLGLDELSPGGRFFGEVDDWLGWLHDLLIHLVEAKAPSHSDEAKDKYCCILARLADMKDDPYEVLEAATKMVLDIERFDRAERQSAAFALVAKEKKEKEAPRQKLDAWAAAKLSGPMRSTSDGKA